MNTPMHFFRYGSIALIILGLGHLSVFFISSAAPLPPEAKVVMDGMKNYMIHFMGEHSLYKFYTGFNIFTGVFPLFFGLTGLFFSPALSLKDWNPTPMLVSCILFTLIGFVLSILYFHVIAYGLFGIAAVCFAIALGRIKNR